MDNRVFDITSQGRSDLMLALSLALKIGSGHKPLTPTHFVETQLEPPMEPTGQSRKSASGTKTLILLWHEEGECAPMAGHDGMLPFHYDLARTQVFVQNWLRKLSDKDFGDRPDFDGSAKRGWRMFTDFWGHVAGYRYAVCGIQPAWAWFGK